MKSTLLAIVGAVVGGALGHIAFSWLVTKGFYGMILPGGLLGIGAGIGKVQSKWLALTFGLAALCLGLFTEWRYFPSPKDESLGHFLRHVTDRGTVTLLMIAAGGVLGFWVPYRRAEEPKK
ncbi:MAG: hypothetical protein ACM3U2_16610 [Deltaproteobacteria bacterium]